MTRVVFAPDSFGGTLSAGEAAEAMASGWLRARPADDVHLAPMSDGGPGLVAAALSEPGVTGHDVATTDPLGRPLRARVAVDGSTAYVESALAAGIGLLSPDERDPVATSTLGVGQLVRYCLDQHVETVVVGLGGSATNDGGMGALEALGAVFTDAQGNRVAASGGGMTRVAGVDLSGLHPGLDQGSRIVLATDVDNPLLGSTGASRGFAPQKGANPAAVRALEEGMTTFATVVERAVGRPGLHQQSGAGAAGGLGFALMAVGAQRRPGFDVVADLVGLRHAIRRSDVVVTGEGRLDWQSLHGKVVHGVAATCRRESRPCVAVVGSVQNAEHVRSALRLAGVYSLARHAGSRQRALADAARLLADLCALVASRVADPPSRAGGGFLINTST